MNIEAGLPKVQRSTMGYEGKVIDVRVDLLELQGDAQEPICTLREVAVHAPVVVILAERSDGKIALVQQYRHPVGREILEFPAGKIDIGETPIEAARRELQEETGLIPGTIGEGFILQSSPGWVDESVHCFHAMNCTQGMFLPADDSDQIKVLFRTPQDIFQLIKDNQIISAKDIALFAWIYLTGDFE